MVKKKVKKKKVSKPKNSPKKVVSARIQTGISGFDQLINGGFENITTNLIVGGAGSGKSIFATGFLKGGMDAGEKTLYITFEEKKAQFFSHMKKVGCDLEKYEKSGHFTFLEYAPAKVKKMLEEGGGAVESIILKKKITRVVIDSKTSFALLFQSELEKRESSLKLFNLIGSWNCTSLLTYEKGTISKRNSNFPSKSLQFESDSIIILYNLRNKNKRQRYLEILKMRGTPHSKKIHNFEITSSGVKVNPRPSTEIPEIL